MQLIDGHHYVIDTRRQTERVAHGQPPQGFAAAKDAYDWAHWHVGAEGFSVRQFSAIFTVEARQAAEGHAFQLADQRECAASQFADDTPFDDLPFDERVRRLADVDIERITFADPEGHDGDYARVTLRFPTGDGLVISPCPDGTLFLAWNYPDGPREQQLHYGGTWTPELLDGRPMFEGEVGVGPVLGVVVDAQGDEGDVSATIRLTDAGRERLAST
jgi:hypothetical protein